MSQCTSVELLLRGVSLINGVCPLPLPGYDFCVEQAELAAPAGATRFWEAHLGGHAPACTCAGTCVKDRRKIQTQHLPGHSLW